MGTESDDKVLKFFYSKLSVIGECFSMGKPIGRPPKLSENHYIAMVDILHEMTTDMKKLLVTPTRPQLQKLIITIQMLGKVWLDVKGYNKFSEEVVQEEDEGIKDKASKQKTKRRKKVH